LAKAEMERARLKAAGIDAHATCDMSAHAYTFLKTLGIPDEYLDPKHNKCYCAQCWTGSDTIMEDGPTPYVVPKGWYRFGLVAAPRLHDPDLDVFQTWSVSFHGVSGPDVLRSVLQTGQLMKAGDKLLDGSTLRSSKCAGRQDRVFYTSPTIQYAGLKFYAEPQPFGDNMAASIVLQCRQKPGSFRTQGETMEFRRSNAFWLQHFQREFPHVKRSQIEWKSEMNVGACPYGLLVRPFQWGADDTGSMYASPLDKDPGCRWRRKELQAMQKRAAWCIIGAIAQQTDRALGMVMQVARGDDGIDVTLKTVKCGSCVVDLSQLTLASPAQTREYESQLASSHHPIVVDGSDRDFVGRYNPVAEIVNQRTVYKHTGNDMWIEYSKKCDCWFIKGAASRGQDQGYYSTKSSSADAMNLQWRSIASPRQPRLTSCPVRAVVVHGGACDGIYHPTQEMQDGHPVYEREERTEGHVPLWLQHVREDDDIFKDEIVTGWCIKAERNAEPVIFQDSDTVFIENYRDTWWKERESTDRWHKIDTVSIQGLPTVEVHGFPARYCGQYVPTAIRTAGRAAYHKRGSSYWIEYSTGEQSWFFKDCVDDQQFAKSTGRGKSCQVQNVGQWATWQQSRWRIDEGLSVQGAALGGGQAPAVPRRRGGAYGGGGGAYGDGGGGAYGGGGGAYAGGRGGGLFFDLRD
jgi:hypothetical protein